MYEVRKHGKNSARGLDTRTRFCNERAARHQRPGLARQGRICVRGCSHLSSSCHHSGNLTNRFRAIQASATCFFSFSILVFTAGCPDVVGSLMSSTLSGTSWYSTHKYFRYVFLFPVVRLNIHVVQNVTRDT